MVLRRRLDYRVNGYHFPSFPHVPVSAKGKRSVRKRNVENRMCAFDLLAAVAGKLLDRENSSATRDVPESSISDSKQEILNEQKACDDEFPVQGSHSKASKVTRSGFILGKERSMTLKLSGTSLVSLCSGLSNEDVMGERGSKATHSLEHRVYEAVMDGNPSGCYNLDGSAESVAKPPLIKSESSMKLHISRDNDPYSSSFPHSWNGLEHLVHSDDDENSSRCARPCTTTIKALKPHLGEHRLRKLLASRYWKVDLGAPKHTELSKTDVDLKPAFRSRKISFTRRRTQRISLKRRKLFNRYSVSASHKGFNRAGVLNLLKENEILEGSGSASLHGVNGISSSITEQLSSRKPEDFHVKLSIKSFVVPELFIEIPETATVGSLKRTVMEEITAIIRSGLHVGVLLQGKDVRDDDRTLIQAGISHANELDELSFSLEPNSSFPSSRYPNSRKRHFFLPCDTTDPLSRLPAGPSFDSGQSDSSSYHALTSTILSHQSNHNSAHSVLDAPVHNAESSQALSASPATSVEALSVVPVDKLRQSELGKRRIRRPFGVSEVEALVKAVESLGTGRWRDVKIQSFDSVKHRTYVDLKDKWKTLVHTARISPQHRRGEPVPQELLDRVLRAHAHWSQQQVKLQAKAL